MSLISRWLGGDRAGDAPGGVMALAGGAEVRTPDLPAEAYTVLGPGGAPSSAGVYVSEEGSLRLTAVAAAIRILSNSVAMLPLPVYRRIKGGKAREYSHPLYRVLQEQANPEWTAFEMRRWLMQGAVGWGNGYGWLEWSKSGTIEAIWPMRPDRTVPVRRNATLLYQYTYDNGTTVDVPAYQVLHVRGLSLDGMVGISPIRQMMREAVGLGLAAQEFGARFYSNGAQPGGVLEHPGALSEKARANVLSSWAGTHQGVGNAHKFRILEEGMKYHVVTIPPNEAQFIETRKFQVSEIARAFGVPPHLIGDLDKATFSNIEHQAIEFAQYSLQPWMTQIEQAINAKCLVGEDERYLFVEHVSEALVKTDIKTRYEAHQIAILTGFETPNEARAAENRNPLPGGDVLLQPLNMAPMGSNAKPDTEAQRHGEEQRLIAEGAEKSEEGREWVLAPVVRDCAERLARREFADRKRGRTGFEEELLGAVRQVLTPVVRAMGGDPAGAWWWVGAAEVLEMAAADEAERAAQWDEWFVSSKARCWRVMEGDDGTARI